MPLFKTIAEIKQYVTISNANTNASLPPLRLAEEDFIIPVLGQTLFNSLQAEVDSGTIDHVDLLDKVRMALGFLAYYKDLPLLHTNITDSGLRNVTTDKMQGAYRYQYEDVKQHLENEGLAGLERLYLFLFANKADYPDWEDSDAYERLNKNIIKTGAEFSQYYYLFQPNRTFFALQPVMQEVEDLFLGEVMDVPFFKYLNTLTEPTDDEVTVIGLLKKAIANFTIYKAISKLRVKVRPEGFTVMLASTDRTPQGEQNATSDELQDLKNDTYKDGNTYLARAMSLITTKATALIFPLYFSSTFYKDPAIVPDDINDAYGMGIYAF